jgi:hypothetical protein
VGHPPAETIVSEFQVLSWLISCRRLTRFLSACGVVRRERDSASGGVGPDQIVIAEDKIKHRGGIGLVFALNRGQIVRRGRQRGVDVDMIVKISDDVDSSIQ